VVERKTVISRFHQTSVLAGTAAAGEASASGVDSAGVASMGEVLSAGGADWFCAVANGEKHKSRPRKWEMALDMRMKEAIKKLWLAQGFARLNGSSSYDESSIGRQESMG
jgi:hypothetical protein